jgi:MoaA/NifB/PqqE/SkfB family radical SAM enzyme
MNKKEFKALVEISKVDLANNSGVVTLYHDPKKDTYCIHRFAARGKIDNWVANYEYIDNEYNSELLPIDEIKGKEILRRIENNENYSGVYIFYEANKNPSTENLVHTHSAQEHTYTSTGIKFWKHQNQMFEYKNGGPNTVISTHISPEGSCNLKCPYCSVTYRDTHSRLEMDTIKDYVMKLKTRGLKAVILTGGGEPTAYKHFNELVRWLNSEDLSVALITNGTLTKRIDDDVWKMFSWIRVSINVFGTWLRDIKLPKDKIDFDKTIVGCSMVYTVEHEKSDEVMSDRVALLNKASIIADNCGAKYVRLLPNCLLDQEDLIKQHKALEKTLEKMDDTRFFHQYKIHGAPKVSTCHQAYFRPYLSEEIHVATGKSGTVYPCDSVVLNDSYQHFAEEYQLCHASDILDYLDKKIEQQFDAKTRCTGCVFTDNVNMLDDFINNKIDRFEEFKEPLIHEEFV